MKSFFYPFFYLITVSITLISVHAAPPGSDKTTDLLILKFSQAQTAKHLNHIKGNLIQEWICSRHSTQPNQGELGTVRFQFYRDPELVPNERPMLVVSITGINDIESKYFFDSFSSDARVTEDGWNWNPNQLPLVVYATTHDDSPVYFSIRTKLPTLTTLGPNLEPLGYEQSRGLIIEETRAITPHSTTSTENLLAGGLFPKFTSFSHPSLEAVSYLECDRFFTKSVGDQTLNEVL